MLVLDFPYLEPMRSDRDSWNTRFCVPQAWYGTKSSSEAIFVQVADIWGATTFWLVDDYDVEVNNKNNA